jgi:mitochondrial fission protein ELM1
VELIGDGPGAVGFSRAQPISIWAVSDGRAGIAAQALGLAESVARRTNAVVTVKTVSLRSPWSWLHPGLVPAPLQALSVGSDALSPPWPDLWIACGRQSIPFSMGVRGWSRGKTLTVQVQDPRINPREFDIVVPPLHDGLEGQNVWPTLGAVHRVTPQRIADEAMRFPQDLAALPGPRVAVLIGGKSKRQGISGKRAALISRALVALKEDEGGSLLVTLSRRTGAAARRAFAETLKPAADLYYDAEGPNPYFALLAAADAICVTADSVNMAAEACATGKPVLILPVDGDPGKLDTFHQGLVERGCARPFLGVLERWTYEPLLEADRIARRLVEAMAARMG